MLNSNFNALEIYRHCVEQHLPVDLQSIVEDWAWLAYRKKELDRREYELNDRELELEDRERGLEARERELSEREAARGCGTLKGE